MFSKILNRNNLFFVFVFHVLLGLVSTVSPLILVVYFYLILFSSIPFVLKKTIIDDKLSFLLVYLVSFEMLARMANATPFIPYEIGKYLTMILLVMGILKGHNKGPIGFFLILLVLPATIYDLSGQVDFKGIVFNLFGTINIGLAIWYFSKQKFTTKGLWTLIYLMLLPLIATLAFVFIKTPSFDEIEFILGANFETSGNFGSNQVSTAFGLAILLTAYLWLMDFSITGKRSLDLVIFLLFAFQGVLSFSRGGMIGGVLSIVIVVFYLSKTSKASPSYAKLKLAKRYILPTLILLSIVFFVANKITNNQLLLRYQGETAGTLKGTKDKDINTISSGRSDIALGDFALYDEYGFYGVGAGASRYLRKTHNGTLAHVEWSRLIAEHGILGILFIIVVVINVIQQIKKKQDNLIKGILIAFLFLGWYTTFHNASRTYLTPMLIGVSLIYVINDKSTLPRK